MKQRGLQPNQHCVLFSLIAHRHMQYANWRNWNITQDLIAFHVEDRSSPQGLESRLEPERAWFSRHYISFHRYAALLWNIKIWQFFRITFKFVADMSLIHSWWKFISSLSLILWHLRRTGFEINFHVGSVQYKYEIWKCQWMWKRSGWQE